MPSKKQYNLVQNDDYDSRIPLHSEEAFHHGITFQAKYIGTLDVPRPTSRVEIVAAMRRIRYEFKAKGIKKKKVSIEVSVDGVKVTLRKKKKKKDWLESGGNAGYAGRPLLLTHPIYRIFYVSHDSQDMKIFSYIARDAATNVFKCNVFKSNKKNQAMRVVRTVGQAFEVCHKLSIEEAPSPEPQELISSLQDELDLEESNLELTANSDHASDRASDQISVHKRDLLSEPVHNESSSMAASELMNGGGEGVQQRPSRLEMLPPPPLAPGSKKTPLTTAEMYSSPLVEPLKPTGGGSLPQPGSPLSPHHEVQLLREQLDQQTQQTQAAVAQMQLLQDQLSAERAARLEAQARTHQLLVHNRELLDHITALVAHLQDNERGSGAMQTAQNSASQVPTHLTCMTQQRCDPGSPYLSDSSYLLSGPESPIRKTNSGNMFAFNSYPQEHHLAAPHIIKQYLDAYSNPPYSGYNHYAAYAPTAAPPPPPPPQSYLYQNNNHNHSTNNNNILQPPPALTKKKLSPSPRPLRQSYETFTNIYGGDNGGDVYGAGGGGAYANDFCEKNKNLIKPLSQVSTLTTTDEEGRVRVIVPVSDEDDDKVVESLVTLKITDEDGNKRVINGGPPCITRSTSEKLPNRSELMSQVQRTMWARHTTK